MLATRSKNRVEKQIGGNKKKTTIRLNLEQYHYIKSGGKLNNRTISGQANWVCRVIEILQDDYPNVYAEIAHKLNKAGY